VFVKCKIGRLTPLLSVSTMADVSSEYTPAQRASRSRLAAHTSWANTENRSARTAPARAAMQRKFERQVDPEGILPADELAKRVASARRAHYTRLSMIAQQRRKATEQ
jgi:hypothetical protein